jgi:hypothetical protein
MDGPGISGTHGQKRLRSRPFPSHLRPGVSRIFLTAPLSYAAVGFPPDRGEKLLATENSQPVTCEHLLSLGDGMCASAPEQPAHQNMVTSHGSFSIMRPHHPWLSAGEAS